MKKTECRSVQTPLGVMDYTLERKPVKNLNLRVRPDGSVYVSAHGLWPVGQVDAFVASRCVFIADARMRLTKKEQMAAYPSRFENGETFMLLGQPARLEVYVSHREHGEWTEATLRLYVQSGADRTRVQRLFQKEWDKRCMVVFQESLSRHFAYFQQQGLAIPALRIREMKSRWGSCHTGKKQITLNKRLLCAPLTCVDYVALHELCHLIHPNHSAAFHSLMQTLMPDWKARKGLLEATAGKTL